MKVVISPSTNSKKKYMAVFTDSPSFKKKTVHFGSAGMSDFTPLRQVPFQNGFSGTNQH